MFCFYGIFPRFQRHRIAPESRQNRHQKQGSGTGIRNGDQEWGTGMGGRAVFIWREGQMKSARLSQQKCSGHGRKGGLFPGRGSGAICAICLYPLADAFCHAGNGVQIERFCNGTPILFGYQNSLAAFARDKNRLMAFINCINQFG